MYWIAQIELWGDQYRKKAMRLRIGRGNNGSQNRSPQREQLELEIASRLSEANSYEEQAAFEELISGSIATKEPKLDEAISAAEQIYVCSLPWMREERSDQTLQKGAESKTATERVSISPGLPFWPEEARACPSRGWRKWRSLRHL